MHRDPVETEGEFNFSGIMLGPIGRPEAKEVNDAIKNFLPYVYKLIQDKKLWPSETVQIGEGGFEDVIKSYDYQTSGKGGNKKVIVKLADE